MGVLVCRKASPGGVLGLLLGYLGGGVMGASVFKEKATGWGSRSAGSTQTL